MATGLPTQKLQEIRLVLERQDLPPPIRRARDVLPYLLPHVEGLHREAFFSIPLNAKHRPLGIHVVSLGTVTQSLVSPREVFLPAILAGATAVLVVHNHPSGDPTPSQQDRDVTRRLELAGQLLDLPLLDHLVLGTGSLFSFVENQTHTF